MLARRLQRREPVKFRQQVRIGPVVEQVARHRVVPLNQASDQRRALDLGVLVIGVYAPLDMVAHTGQIALDSAGKHVFPITSGHGVSFVR